MNKVADTIVSYMFPNKMQKGNKYQQESGTRTGNALQRIDGDIYDSAELDSIYKVFYEHTVNGTPFIDVDLSLFPKRCQI